MARQDGNGTGSGGGGGSEPGGTGNGRSADRGFAGTSFLYGGNAAFIEQLHERYRADPASVDAEWREFFAELGDDADAVERAAHGPAWKAPNWPIAANGELVSALDGDWPSATRRSSASTASPRPRASSRPLPRSSAGRPATRCAR